MPYELSFTKQFPVSDPDRYINECCWGGDVVLERLLPGISRVFEDVSTEQEDWGWFIWFKKGEVALAVDIFCDDSTLGQFRIHLTSRKKRWLIGDSIVDLPELEAVRELVTSEIEGWCGNPCIAERLDSKYLPLRGAV